MNIFPIISINKIFRHYESFQYVPGCYPKFLANINSHEECLIFASMVRALFNSRGWYPNIQLWRDLKLAYGWGYRKTHMNHGFINLREWKDTLNYKVRKIEVIVLNDPRASELCYKIFLADLELMKQQKSIADRLTQTNQTIGTTPTDPCGCCKFREENISGKCF